MSVFKWETRTCTCGTEFSALDFWEADAKCGECSTRSYEAEIARLNEGKPYRIASIGGMCPTQAEGATADGRRFYFRARHGDWALTVADTQEAAYGRWDDDADLIAEGDDDTGGCMDNAAVVAILDQHLGGPS